MRTVVNLQALNPGFDPDDLVVVALDHPLGGPLGDPTDARVLEQVTRRLESSPGILAVTPVQMAPLPGNGAWQSILYKDSQTPEQALDENVYLFMEFVESDFTEVLDVPVLEGRTFTDADDRDAPWVVMVNRAAALAYWPGEDAVGQQVTTGFPGAEGRALTVVGVVADTRYGALREIEPAVYFPLRQTGVFQSRHLLVRTTGAPAPVFRLAREALAAEGSAYRAISAETVRDRLAEPLVRPRFAAWLLTTLALTALVIAVAGVYGTMAFRVRARRRELGVRMACGGSPRTVAGRVVRRGLVIAGVGGLTGVGAAVLSGGLFQSLLFGVGPSDPGVLLAALVVSLACAGLACAIPARQAAALDP
ncbi:MAG TPA: ABC transporter permease, partial [Longimicrobiales bacterium]|nr:ABC transporter permease [Longimicrobiales bacterium]